MGETLDDSDDKVRRNLVAYSSGVIVSWWLGVPLAEVLRSIKVDVRPTDLLAPGIATLTYLLYRYRFIPETDKWVLAMQGNILNLQIERADKSRDRSLAHYCQTGTVVPPLVSNMDQLLEPHKAKLMGARPSRLPVARQGPLASPPWDRTFSVLPQHSGDLAIQDDFGHFLEVPVRFEVTGKARTWIRAMSALEATFYTRFAATVLAPLALALLAMTILLFRIGAAYFN